MVQKRQLSQRRNAPVSPRGVVVVAALSMAACSSEAPTESNRIAGRTLAVALGQDFQIRLQSIGSGEYRSPPAISSRAIKFQDVTLATLHMSRLASRSSFVFRRSRRAALW